MTAREGNQVTRNLARTLLKALPVALLVSPGFAADGAYFARFQVTPGLHGFAARDCCEVTFRHRTGKNPPAYQAVDWVR